jgi:hypothetical protein
LALQVLLTCSAPSKGCNYKTNYFFLGYVQAIKLEIFITVCLQVMPPRKSHWWI